MNTLWIYNSYLILILVTNFTESLIINGSNLRSLTCLGMNTTKEHCRVLIRVVALPDKLLQAYVNLKEEVRDAFDSGDLTQLSHQQLNSIHPSLLLLIPSTELSRVDGEKLALLLRHWSNEQAIARHITFAASLGDNMNAFIKKVQTLVWPDDILDMVAEYLSADKNFGSLGPILPHLPYYRLVNFPEKKRNKMLFFLKSWLNRSGTRWSNKKRSILRAWARMLIEADYPKPLHNWNDVDIKLIGDVLIGATPSELNDFKGDNIYNKFDVLHFNFTTLQFRTLFKSLFNESHFTKADFTKSEHVLVRLLPTQLQRFSNKLTHYSRMKAYISKKSRATSNQVLQYLLNEVTNSLNTQTFYSKENVLLQFGRMVYTMPVSSLRTYLVKPISLDKLLAIQSQHLSPTQVYYMTNKGDEMELFDESITSCNNFLHALPTSKIVEGLDTNVISHLALNLPTDNIPRLMKFFSASQILDRPDILIKLFSKPTRLNMFEVYPTRMFVNKTEKLARVLETLSDEFHQAWISLPNNLALAVYKYLNRRQQNKENEVNLLQSHLVYGFTCEEIVDLPIPDFIITISKYRKIISMKNKEFPKDLQQCYSEKLIDYLRMKSYFIQQFKEDSLIGLLTPSEIEAVGGWVLLTLSVNDIKNSPYMTNIIKQIGSLSVPELLVAAPLHKIRAIIDVMLQVCIKSGDYGFQVSNNTIGMEELYLLGNLVTFMHEDSIAKIDSKSMKMILEGGTLDTRLCVTSAQRHSWKQLLLQTFGTPSNWAGEELEFLGDMLIVLPEESLDEIQIETWIQVADLLNSRYVQTVQWHKDINFHQLCENILHPTESEMYAESIKSLIYLYLTVAQLQLDTVKSANLLQPSLLAKEINRIDKENKNEIYEKDLLLNDESSSLKQINEGISKKLKDVIEYSPEDSSGKSENYYTNATEIPSNSMEEKEEFSPYDDYEVQGPFGSSEYLDKSNSPLNQLSRESSHNDFMYENNGTNLEHSTNKIVEPFSESYIKEKINSTDISDENYNNKFVLDEFQTNLEVTNSTNSTPMISAWTEQSTIKSNLDVTTTFRVKQGIEDKQMYNSTDSGFGVPPCDGDTCNDSAVKDIDKTQCSGESCSNTYRISNNKIYVEVPESTNMSESIDYHEKDLKLIEEEIVTNYENVSSNSIYPKTADSSEKGSDQQNFTTFDSVSTTRSVKEFLHKPAGKSQEGNENETIDSKIKGFDENIAESTSDFSSFHNNSSSDEEPTGSFESAVEYFLNEPHHEQGNQYDGEDLLMPILGQTTNDSNHKITKDGAKVIQPINSNMLSSTVDKTRFKLEHTGDLSTAEKYKSLMEAFDIMRSEDAGNDYYLNYSESDTVVPITKDQLTSEYNHHSTIAKRSILSTRNNIKITCDAIRVVGKSSELILSHEIISQMSDEELTDCTEFFTQMNLPDHIQQAIWFRLDKNDMHIKGRLTEFASIDDINNFDLNISTPWVIESVHAISKFNNHQLVRKYIEDQMMRERKQLQVEEVVALGKVICDIPDLEEIISPFVFLRSAVVLGSSLWCNIPCLETLASIATNQEAFGNPENWTSSDVNDLGIIVAGLIKEDWEQLVTTNPNILFGLRPSAGSCLPGSHIKLISATDIQKIPHFTRILIRENLNSESLSQEQMDALSYQVKIDLNELNSDESNSTMNVPKLLSILIVSIILLCL